MNKDTYNSVPGGPELPASVAENDPDAINRYAAELVIHAAKVERQTDSEKNEFRWSINEDMEFRGTIVTEATVAIG